MEITEVKLVLKEGPDKKLKAYATLTFDNCFVVRNVKVIKGTKGLFVAMPSRRMKEACPKCNHKNVIRSRFCNQCGSSLPLSGVKEISPETKQSEHKDIAHPITLECREYIQKKVLDAYEAELKKTDKDLRSDSVEKAETTSGKSDNAPVEPAPPKEEEGPKEDTGDIAL